MFTAHAVSIRLSLLSAFTNVLIGEQQKGGG
jgi:hypothetical protein